MHEQLHYHLHFLPICFLLLSKLTVMVMVLHLYSAFSTWIYSNALYNTLWGTFVRMLYGTVHNLFM